MHTFIYVVMVLTFDKITVGVIELFTAKNKF